MNTTLVKVEKLPEVVLLPPMPFSRYQFAFFLSQVHRGWLSGAYRKQLSYRGDFLDGELD